jgi:hypothetical protein
MKLGVCVPYRNRAAHLKEFIPRVGKHLEEQGIHYHIYFAHQVDDKLFNRGATKNIAAKHAFEDGCDYIVWHDIDMIPEEGVDYSYPDKYPIHLATRISQMGYRLKYHEYFGGAVLFNKEHVEKTNGYSNDYWDWGMEDDDLFWRCHLEGLTNDTYLPYKDKAKAYIGFNGKDSWAQTPKSRDLLKFTSKTHTITALVRPYQQPQKVDEYLIGGKNKRYVEYPIVRMPGYDYGFAFNNSRALTLQFWNKENQHNYMWLKRYSGQWSYITAVINQETKKAHFYLNGSQVDTRAGQGSPSPLKFKGDLKKYFNSSLFLGTTPSLPEEDPGKYFKGDIADVAVWDRALSDEEIKNLHIEKPNDNLVYDLNISYLKMKNCDLKTEVIKVPNSIIPHRKLGRFECLPHKDEGLVNGKWAKGETTARNERRYVLEMQKGSWDYKNDGIKQLEYKLVDKINITPKATMINIEL